MTPLDRIVVLIALALVVAAVIAAVRAWNRARLRQLQGVSAETFWDALGVESDGRPVVVAFSSPGCAVCRTAQRPALRALREKSAHDPRVVAVDVSERPDLASTFGVLTVPSTVVLSPRGRVVTANHGFAPAGLLTEQVGRAAAE